MTLRHLPVVERLDRDTVRSLGSEWDELLANSDVKSPFLTWPWIGAWLDTLGADADLEVVTARDANDGRLIGIAPFFVASRRRAGVMVRELRLLGSDATAPDHLDLIVRTASGAGVADVLWTAVGNDHRWDVLDLDGVVSNGHLPRLTLRRKNDRAERIPVPHLPLSEDWSEVTARFGRSHRQNLKRYARKLDAEAGAPVEERMVTTPEDLNPTFDALVRMHQAIRTAKGSSGVFSDPEVIDFLRLAAQRLLQAGRLRMWRLDVGGQPIAVIWCMRAFDVVAFYTTGFDQEWARYGPGRRIMARAIQSAASEGAADFDFLRGDESYKRAWGAEERENLRIRRPTSRRGRALWVAKSIVGSVKPQRRGAD